MSHSGSIVDLYTRIPDYSEVKHLGNSDFINTVERLKEEFRKCRAILNEDSDVEYICSQTSKVLNISQNNQSSSQNVYSHSHSHSQQQGQSSSKKGLKGSSSRNVNIVSPKGTSSNIFYLPATNNINNSSLNKPNSSYLSISSCALHKNPNEYNLMGSNCNLRSDRIPSASTTGTFGFVDRNETKTNWDDSAYAQDFELCSSNASTPESILSRWSSSPEINLTREKEYNPPTNIEKRILFRRSQNNSFPSIPDIEPKSPRFKAHPVPAHVHKPLFDYIMLKNKKRSDRVKEQSKQKLLAQVKPFSFSKSNNESKFSKCPGTLEICERAEEFLLNNSRPVKNRRHHNSNHSSIKTNNNKFTSSHHQFKANPAPPRTKALLSAIKLREQQEYRALKKRLRSEAMMKTASLPPSMAARDRRTKANLTRLDNLLSQFHAAVDYNKDMKNKRHFRESSTETFTDDDRLTEGDDFYNGGGGTARHHVRGRGSGLGLTSALRPTTSGGNTSRHRHKSGKSPLEVSGTMLTNHASKLFETTSNDNHASKLRIQVAKAKELGYIQKEEEELLRAMKTDKKRQKLRDAHFQAWRRAGSYSSAQDIAMRRQLRQAAAILDRESYRKEMSTMLSRVRSAPLLLEGRERKSEPCKKHRTEGWASNTKTLNKLSSPRYTGQQYFNSKLNWGLGRENEPEKSETAAMAEGSLTNSDNESVKNPDLEFDQFEQDFEEKEEQESQQENGNNRNHHNNINSQNIEPDSSGQEYSNDNHHHHNGTKNGTNDNSPPLIDLSSNNDPEDEENDEDEQDVVSNVNPDNDDYDNDYQADEFEEEPVEDLNDEEDIFANF